MASRKKIPDPEIVPDEIEIDAKQVRQPTRKVVETKTITYDAPAEEAEAPEEDEDFDFEEKPKRSKPTLKQEKQKLRDRWAKRGIAPTGNLRISLWKFTNEDDPMSGNQADKAFCSKFVTTESAIDDGIHLDAASKFGPGRYWIMIYLNNQIVDQWEFRIAAGQQMGQMQNGQQMVSMPDPQNPNVIVQMPANQPQQQSDPFADLDKSLKFIERMERMRQALGISPAPVQNPVPPQSPEISVAELLMKDPHHAKKIVGNLIGGEGEKDLMALAFEHGPALIESLGSAIRNILSDFRGSNGTPQMAQTAFQDRRESNNQTVNQGGNNYQQHLSEAGQEGEQGLQASEHGSEMQSNGTQQSIRPEDELLAGILDHCKRKMPPKLAADRAMKYAEYVEQVAPHQSIFTILESFVDSPVADSLALLAMTSEEAAEIIKLPHAESWATQLQAELKKAYEPGGVEQ